ncbi:hypothetical protein MSG28_007385 [Choristoneura fumiferana]|uniref:Uncharacterized protein n=1 Tax=Choristoneura fumiferana TaxID=7141 RepID=A0ACC0JX37_CHOFU|nr:hypothetical protein MSG28_007385 [Choristoneura fumiferana]
MEHILQAVRCQYLTPSFLKEQMSSCSVLQKVPACREYLARIFQDLTLHKKPVVKERRPNTPRIIYVAGGYFRHSIDVFEAFNLDDGSWTTLPRLTVPRSGLGAAFLKGLFYAVGGRNTSPGSSYDSDWVDVYNPAAEHWRPCSPMSVPRHRVGVAVMDGLLYAVGGSAGGYDGTSFLDIVEVYDPSTSQWQPGPPLTSVRSGHASAVCYQHVALCAELADAEAELARRAKRPPSATSSRGDDIPMAGNIIGTLSNNNCRGCL